MIKSQVLEMWVSMEDSPRGCERVINVATDVVVERDLAGYDYQKAERLFEETRRFVTNGACARVEYWHRSSEPHSASGQ